VTQVRQPIYRSSVGRWRPADAVPHRFSTPSSRLIAAAPAALESRPGPLVCRAARQAIGGLEPRDPTFGPNVGDYA
jgi:hypothetical protein